MPFTPKSKKRLAPTKAEKNTKPNKPKEKEERGINRESECESERAGASGEAGGRRMTRRKKSESVEKKSENGSEKENASGSDREAVMERKDTSASGRKRKEKKCDCDSCDKGCTTSRPNRKTKGKKVETD